MKTFVVCLGVALFSLSAVACGGAEEDGTVPGADEEQTADELRTGTIERIEVRRSSGFVPPPPRGRCIASGEWSVDFGSKKLVTEGCQGSVRVPVNKTLSDEDIARVKSTLSKVRILKRPASCPTDIPVKSLTVFSGSSEKHYVDQRAACGGGATPAKESTLLALVELMEELGAPAPANAVLTVEGTLRSLGMAIGGETTGRGIDTDNGSFELVLDDAEVSEFVAGRKARVSGEKREKRSVEMPNRVRVLLDVQELLVCPAPGRTINCMPPTTSKLCHNSQWIEDNCSGVSFTH